MSEIDVDALIDTVAQGPKRAQGDMGSVENHSISDLLALKKVADAETAVSGDSPTLLMNRIVPPGAA